MLGSWIVNNGLERKARPLNLPTSVGQALFLSGSEFYAEI